MNLDKLLRREDPNGEENGHTDAMQTLRIEIIKMRVQRIPDKDIVQILTDQKLDAALAEALLVAVKQPDYQDLLNLYDEKLLQYLLAHISSSRRYLWHIALPKSGSSWITRVLSVLLIRKSWKISRLVPSYGSRAHEIDPRYFLLPGRQNDNVFFAHQHCANSHYTELLLASSRTTAFLQTRNLFDVVVSLFDHMCKIRAEGLEGLSENLVDLPWSPKTRDWIFWPDDVLLDYLIEFELPFFIKLLDSWFSSKLVRDGIIRVVRYEDIVKDPVAEILALLAFASVTGVTREDVTGALETARKWPATFTQFNKGVAGRGKQTLSSAHQEKIKKKVGYFKNMDDLIT